MAKYKTRHSPVRLPAAGPDLSVWRPWAGSLLEALPTLECYKLHAHTVVTRSSAIADGPRDASCQSKSCQLPRSSAETTRTTSPEQIEGMKLEG